MDIVEYKNDTPFNLNVKDCGECELLEYDAPYEPEIPQSKRIRVFLYKARNPFYNLIFLHGIGNRNIGYLSWYAKRLARNGVNTFFLILPYHEKRAKENWKGGEPFFHPSPSYYVVKFHEAVKDVRRTMDLIEKMENYRELPTALMGYSFGGMIGTMALALDKRFKKGVLAFTGGDWRWINWKSPVTEILREMYRIVGNEYGCRLEKNCLKLRGNSLEVVEKFQKLEDIFKKSPVKCFEYDPLSYAKFIEVPVLFFKGIFDKVIPKEATNELILLLPDVRVVNLPCGHKTSYFFRRYITWRTLKYLREN